MNSSMKVSKSYVQVSHLLPLCLSQYQSMFRSNFTNKSSLEKYKSSDIWIYLVSRL